MLKFAKRSPKQNVRNEFSNPVASSKAWPFCSNFKLINEEKSVFKFYG